MNQTSKKVIWITVFVTAMIASYVWALYKNASDVGATRVEKITWCHCEPNGNCQTLELPQQALEQAGHVNAQGNALHAGDYHGECEYEPTGVPATRTVTPTILLTPTIWLTATPSAELTPTLVIIESVTPTSSPSATPMPSVSPEPTSTPVSEKQWEETKRIEGPQAGPRK